MKPIIIIPARMASTRLPDKPLADIAGKPMIVRVWEKAIQSGCGDVVVACDGESIKQVIENAGGKAVITSPDLPSGSDRVWVALSILEQEYDAIINVQGDMPTLDPSVIRKTLTSLENPDFDIATLAAVIRDDAEIDDPAVVKVARGVSGKALYFSRAPIPHGAGDYYHHIGIYAYRRKALETFVNLPPSPLELREKLEQLRALEAGMAIGVTVVDTVPLGVDTPETLEKARKWYEQYGK